ncbi:MAG: hypothetical protein JJ863_03180 [Deltaproteobacteria bacterium]|nr:hypothetical protein [Deltaproteobacteria bacterium]
MVRFSALALVICLGCGESTPADPDGGPVAMPLSCGVEPCDFVISALRVPRVDAAGRVIGVDLDDHVSDETSPRSCGHADFVAPDGTMGVDNQFVEMVPTLEAALGTPVADARDTSIANGTFLFGLTLASDGSDPAISVRAGSLAVADGTEPQLDASGGLLASQPFVWEDAPMEGEATLIDGVLDASIGDVEVTWPFDETTEIEIPVSTAHIVVPVVDREPGIGVLVGRIDIDELIRAGGMTDPSDLLRRTLEERADLDPDSEGVCQAISIAVEVELVRARIDR